MQAPEGIIIIMWFYTLLMSPTYPQGAQVCPLTASSQERTKENMQRSSTQSRDTMHVCFKFVILDIVTL